MYCDDVIEEVRQKADIKKYFPKDMKCKKCGGKLTVSEKYQMYCCMNCHPDGSGGNVFTAIMESQNIGFVEAVQYLADKEEIKLECDLFKNE